MVALLQFMLALTVTSTASTSLLSLFPFNNSVLGVLKPDPSVFPKENQDQHTCWHVTKRATHTKAPAIPWAALVSKKIGVASADVGKIRSPTAVVGTVSVTVVFNTPSAVVTVELIVVELLIAVLK
jgi:hypothetical protein